jgi:OHCU decarboxylase
MPLEALNTLSVDAFTEILGGIFEHSPWVAQRAAAARPFTSRLQLLDAMRAVVQSAPVEEQLALIRAHPQLGARGRKRLELTEASSREQRRAGLDACTDEEFAELMRLNAAYVQKFSFPFILAVRGHGPESILESMESRINHDEERERQAALTQIGLIGGYRLADVVASPPAAEAAAMAERLAAAATTSDHTAASALLREWMLAANLDIHTDPAHPSEFLGVQAQPPDPRAQASALSGPQPANPQTHGSALAAPQPASHHHLLVGLYSDPITKALHRDGRLAAVLGIAVAQHLRQHHTPTRLGLLVLAAPASSQPGSVLLHPDPPVALGTIDSNTLAPLPAAGITGRCLTIVHQGVALPEGDATTIDRAIRTLEHLLI